MCTRKNKQFQELAETLSRTFGIGNGKKTNPGLNKKSFYCSGLGAGDLPKWPTEARPGTLEKIKVMEERAAARNCLVHPGDADLIDSTQTEPERIKTTPRGVVFRNGRFIAQIGFKRGGTIYLGCFDSSEKAAEVYAKAQKIIRKTRE
jgi:hypothetical protein